MILDNFVSFLNHFELVFGHLGCFGILWGSLGIIFGPLGCLRGRLGVIWSAIGCYLGSFWEHVGGILVVFVFFWAIFLIMRSVFCRNAR